MRLAAKPLLFILITTSVFAQEKKFNFNLSGYINYTAIYDSRQNVSSREGHFLLFPKNELPDAHGSDVNASPNFNMSSIQTRIAAKMAAPEFLGSNPTGVIETEFMGNSESDINGLRLRHAYLNLDWGKLSLLAGQTWNPMFIPEAFPNQIGSNGGAPFQPFSRNPQLRISFKHENIRILAALLSQRDFLSTGPMGTTSEYLRNAVLPDMHLQIQYKNTWLISGVGGEYKSLRPRVKTSRNYITENTVNSSAVMVYSKVSGSRFDAALQAIYGSNLHDLTMLGGYAVRSIDTSTLREAYSPIRTLSAWTDMNYALVKTNSGKLEMGLFAGYTKNLGTKHLIAGEIFSRGADIDHIYRIAPRVNYSEGKIKLCFETEFTSAAYGKADSKARVKDIKNINNLRLYSSVYYFFELF